jgi:Glycosyl hydrolases family 39
MVVSAIPSGWSQAVHDLAMVAGWRYEVTLWMKGSGNASVLFQQQEGTYTIYADTGVLLNSEWTQVRLTSLIPATGPGSLVINATSAADISFDDIDVRAVPASPASVTGNQITSDTFGIHEGRIAEMALRNPGFEGAGRLAGNGKRLATGATISGTTATGWQENSFWADLDVSYAIDATTVHSGGASQRINVGAIRSGQVQIGQNLTVRTPGRFRFTEWVRGAAGTQGTIQIRQSGPPYNGFATTNITFTGAWQQVTVESDLTANDSELFLLTGFDSPGSYWIDDANVINVATGAAPDWIPAPSTGGTMRLWDTQTTWSQLEPQPGVWNFTILDRFVALAQSRQQQVILTLGQTPAWASSNTSELSYNGLGSVYGPKSRDDWRNMVKVIATRYKGRISGYEIWNEPNDPNFGKLSIPELVDLTRIASQEIRATDPAAKVISASPYSVGYLDAYLAGGAADYVDIIGYHEYNNAPETMLASLSNVRYTLADYGVTKPIWLTEGGTGDESQSESVVADGLLRWNLVAMASGMQRAFWYTWGPAINISGTTIKPGTWEPNAAFAALVDMQKRLAGRTLTKATVNTTTGQWVLEFTNAQGNILKASWTRGGSAPAQPVVWS